MTYHKRTTDLRIGNHQATPLPRLRCPLNLPRWKCVPTAHLSLNSPLKKLVAVSTSFWTSRLSTALLPSSTSSQISVADGSVYGLTVFSSWRQYCSSIIAALVSSLFSVDV